MKHSIEGEDSRCRRVHFTGTSTAYTSRALYHNVTQVKLNRAAGIYTMYARVVCLEWDALALARDVIALDSCRCALFWGLFVRESEHIESRENESLQIKGVLSTPRMKGWKCFFGDDTKFALLLLMKIKLLRKNQIEQIYIESLCDNLATPLFHLITVRISNLKVVLIKRRTADGNFLCNCNIDAVRFFRVFPQPVLSPHNMQY